MSIRSLPEPLSGTALLTDVRLGVHPEEGGWDRIVFEFRDVRPAASVSYVKDVNGCGSGAPITLDGMAVLLVRFQATAAHDDNGRPTMQAMDIRGAGSAIREARQTCDFEGEVTWAVGIADQKPFKTIVLTGPTRLVIDVKQ